MVRCWEWQVLGLEDSEVLLSWNSGCSREEGVPAVGKTGRTSSWDLGLRARTLFPYSLPSLQITRINGGHHWVKNMAAVQFAGDGHDKVRMCFVIPMSTFFAGAAERGSSLASFVECCSSLLLKPCIGSQLSPASFCSPERQMGFSQNIFSILLRQLRHGDTGDSLKVMEAVGETQISMLSLSFQQWWISPC